MRTRSVWTRCIRCGRMFVPNYPGHRVCGLACPGNETLEVDPAVADIDADPRPAPGPEHPLRRYCRDYVITESAFAAQVHGDARRVQVDRLERCDQCRQYRPISELEWSGVRAESETQLYRCKNRDACTARARRPRREG